MCKIAVMWWTNSGGSNNMYISKWVLSSWCICSPLWTPRLRSKLEHLHWPAPPDLFHTHTYPSAGFRPPLGSAPWPCLSQPPFLPKWKESEGKRVEEEYFSGGVGWVMKRAKVWIETVSEARSDGLIHWLFILLLCRQTFRCPACELAFIPDWASHLYHLLSACNLWLNSRSNWDITLITNFQCAQNVIKIPPVGEEIH